MPSDRRLVDQPRVVDPHHDVDPYEGIDPTDVADRPLPEAGGAIDDDPLARRRPSPARTWRDRLDDLTVERPPAGRVALALVAVVAVAFVAWRALAPTPGPPEMELPLAEPVATDAGPAATAGGGAARPGAGVPGSVGGGAAAGVATPAAPVEVVVHVVGAVAAPGVQRLPPGARVVDAIEAAGGAAPGADLARVNLAAVLVDGQQVVVLRPGEAAPVPLAGGPAGDGPTGATAGGDGAGPIDINTASASQLEDLPGVGPATAEAIVAHRAANGPFTSVDDLLDVRGIGEAKLAQIRPRATV